MYSTTNTFKSIVLMKQKQDALDNNDFDIQYAIIADETKLHLEKLFD